MEVFHGNLSIVVGYEIADHFQKHGLFLIPNMVLSILDQLQIFCELFLVELLELLMHLGLLELLHLIRVFQIALH